MLYELENLNSTSKKDPLRDWHGGGRSRVIELGAVVEGNVTAFLKADGSAYIMGRWLIFSRNDKDIHIVEINILN
jgi:hypothetical protein